MKNIQYALQYQSICTNNFGDFKFFLLFKYEQLVFKDVHRSQNPSLTE